MIYIEIAVVWITAAMAIAPLVGRGIRRGMTGGPHIKH